MKKAILALLCAALLCGCSPKPEPAPAPTEETAAPTQPTEETTAPTEPEPEPLVVMALPTEDYVDSITVLDGKPVLFQSEDGYSTLTLLSFPEGETEAQDSYPGYVSDYQSPTVTGPQGLAFLDYASRQYVILDNRLTLQRQLDLPDMGDELPIISRDFQSVYYADSDGFYVMDAATGESRLLTKDIHEQYVDPWLTDLTRDSQLAVFITETGYVTYRMDNSAVESWGDSEPTHSWAALDCWTAYANMPEVLFREPDSDQVRELFPLSWEEVTILPELGGVLTLERDEASTILDFYSLPDGHRTGSVTLPGKLTASQIVGCEDAIWILDNESHSIYRWLPGGSDPGDSAVYVDRRFTAEDPDVEGLALVAEEAAALGNRYGIEILVGQQVEELDLYDYDPVAAYQVPLFRKALQTLETVLSTFPEGMLETAAGSEQPLIIGLTGNLVGIAEGTLDTAGGLHTNWEEHSVILANLDSSLTTTLYHELSHLIDSYVFSNSELLDDWNDLNPEGFTYGYDYTDYFVDDDLLVGDDLYFIDSYSTTFPTEDRARIFETATLPERSYAMDSPHIQEKLGVYCLAIRSVYELNPAEKFLWEQYLDNAG